MQNLEDTSRRFPRVTMALGFSMYTSITLALYRSWKIECIKKDLYVYKLLNHNTFFAILSKVSP